MANYDSVFKRKEMKYRIDRATYRVLVNEIQTHLAPLVYDSSLITSIYFDAPDNRVIERSIDKPLYKEKFRMRIYGATSRRAPTYLELKKKFKGVVYKRRVAISYEAAYNWAQGMDYEMACRLYPLLNEEMQEKSLSFTGLQISREIDAFFQRNEHLVPWMVVKCNREQWVDVADDSLRITFDSNLRYQSLFKQDKQPQPIIGQDELIMEIKSSRGLPDWLVALLSKEKVYPGSFSKAGTAYLLSKGSNQAKATEHTPLLYKDRPGIAS